MLNAMIYSGQDDDDNQELGKTAKIFLQLMEKYLDKGCHVFADNYYKSSVGGRKKRPNFGIKKDSKNTKKLPKKDFSRPVFSDF